MTPVQSVSDASIASVAASATTALSTSVTVLEHTLDAQAQAMNQILALLGVGQNLDVSA